MVRIAVLGNYVQATLILFVMGVTLVAQTPTKPKTATSAPTVPKGNPVSSKEAPSLGFNNTKDIPPIMDEDAYMEEVKLKEKLPGNRFVEDKRAFHEGFLQKEFLDGFQNSKECDGITFYRDTAKANTTAQITVMFHDTPNHDQEWIWMLFGGPQQAGKTEKSLSGIGTQSMAKFTARDVCMTMWENIDPNHFKKGPGGTIK